MWIKINNKPISIPSIKEITPVIKCDGAWYRKAIEDHSHNNLYFAVIDALPEELKRVLCNAISDKQTLVAIKNIETYLNTNPKYMFYISYTTYHQRFVNHSYDGMGESMQTLISSIYESESAAQTALDYLLIEMNEIERNLPTITI